MLSESTGHNLFNFRVDNYKIGCMLVAFDAGLRVLPGWNRWTLDSGNSQGPGWNCHCRPTFSDVTAGGVLAGIIPKDRRASPSRHFPSCSGWNPTKLTSKAL